MSIFRTRNAKQNTVVVSTENNEPDGITRREKEIVYYIKVKNKESP